MKLCNAQVMRFLLENHPRTFSANQIVRKTKLSFTTVRNTLNLARERGMVDRELDIGLNGQTIYLWYYCGAATMEPAE